MPIEAGAMRRVQTPSRGCEPFGINHLGANRPAVQAS